MSSGTVFRHKAMTDNVNSEVCEAVVDVLHKHFVDLLNARGPKHSKLAVHELMELVGVVQKCVDLPKKYGLKPVLKLNNIMQVKSKTFQSWH